MLAIIGQWQEHKSFEKCSVYVGGKDLPNSEQGQDRNGNCQESVNELQAMRFAARRSMTPREVESSHWNLGFRNVGAF